MTIKKLKKQEKNNYLQYIINGKKYRAYTISDLPSKFGCKKWNKNEPITKDSNPGEGISTWFTCTDMGSGHSGLTFVSEDYFPTWG